MSYIMGERNQVEMFPASVEDYVGADDPVRAYDAFIEALDFGELGVELEEEKVGSPAYHPKAMMKLLVYGYSYGWRSSRKLERATHHNISFIWLLGGEKPDHKTIANFRKNNKQALCNVLKQCTRLCVELELIEGNCLFLDGSKMRANASINKTKSKQWFREKSREIEERIEKILRECEQADESETGTLVRMKEELKDERILQEKIKRLVKKMEEEEKEKINSTDHESITVKGRQGVHAGYNAQIVVDEKHGLIVTSDVINKNNDLGEFTNQINQACEILGKKPNTVCADAGYSKASDLKKSVDEEIEVIVPSKKQVEHEPKEDDPFNKAKFKYDEEKNQYVCPEGKILRYFSYDSSDEQHKYRIARVEDCLSCKHYGVCTKGKQGRTLKRLKDEKIKEDLERLYNTQVAQEIYKKRKEKVELPFGHIKRNLNGGAFLLRGINGAKAEMAINSLCFNVARMITILGGVRPLIEKLRI